MRPSFVEWAKSPGGLYLHDKQVATLATFQNYQIDIFKHIFPGGCGTLPYNRVLYCDVKKSGKTEIAYGVHSWFALFLETPGEQYVLANDFEGARGRVFRALDEGLQRNPLLKKDKDWWLTGNEIKFSNGTTIKAIASDFAGEAGANLSLATVDEPWGIMHERSERLMTEFSPVPTRENSLIFYTGYQGFEGQSSFWHTLIDEVMKGEPVPELMHIDNGDGQPACWRNGRMFLFWNHKGRQPWHTDAYYAEERKAYAGRINEYLRVHENRRVKNVDAFCTDEQWDRLFDPQLQALNVGDKRPVMLAVDAATKKDCTALVGTTWNHSTNKVEVVYFKVWSPEVGAALKLSETVGPEIVKLHQQYAVMGCYYDPFQMAVIADMCRSAGVPMVEFPQTTRRIQSDTYLKDLITGGNIAHYGDPIQKEHITNAVATTQRDRGIRINKDSTSRKIDGAVATAMAALGAMETLAGGVTYEMKQEKNPFYK